MNPSFSEAASHVIVSQHQKEASDVFSEVGFFL